MAQELAGRTLLDGWRGGPTLDPTELGRIIATLGGLVSASPHLDEVEVNPLRLTTAGLVALDAVVIVEVQDGTAP
jgi:acetyltransferase